MAGCSHTDSPMGFGGAMVAAPLAAPETCAQGVPVWARFIARGRSADVCQVRLSELALAIAAAGSNWTPPLLAPDARIADVCGLTCSGHGVACREWQPPPLAPPPHSPKEAPTAPPAPAAPPESLPPGVDIARFSGTFGGVGSTAWFDQSQQVVGGEYVFPSSAEVWGGVANTNANLYPLSVSENSVIMFEAAAEAEVRLQQFALRGHP
jgi:hypothetical protein